MTEGLRIGNLDHVGLSVADLDAQVEWYKRVLGLHEVASERLDIAEPPLRIALLSGESGPCLELIEHGDSSRRNESDQDPVGRLLDQGYHHWAFTVANLDDALARIEAAGVKQIGSRQDYPSHGVRLACIVDPEGNMIELIEPVAAEAAEPAAGTWHRARHDLATYGR